MKFKTKKGNTIIIDDDMEPLSRRSWQLNSMGYARRTVYSKEDKKSHTQLMHRFIAGASTGEVVDHINHDKLDNRRENLRICSQSDNLINSRKTDKNASSKYKGVCLAKNFSPPRWEASIKYKDFRWREVFTTEIEAAKAYNVRAAELFGEYAHINIL